MYLYVPYRKATHVVMKMVLSMLYTSRYEREKKLEREHAESLALTH